MKSIETKFDLKYLRGQLKGALYWKMHYRMLYATDGSVYKKLPLAVAYPKDKEDIKIILTFAKKNNIGIIPRTAGTSLAGQCVGDGIVIDVSKHFTKILSLDLNQKKSLYSQELYVTTSTVF